MSVQPSNLIDELANSNLPRSLAERRLALAGLGILRALRDSKMTIEEAEQELFNLDSYKAARRRRYDRRLIEFLEWGMELDDVAQLAPHAIEESYESMEQLLLSVIAQSLGRKTARRKA
jgi:hypothetical protein